MPSAQARDPGKTETERSRSGFSVLSDVIQAAPPAPVAIPEGIAN